MAIPEQYVRFPTRAAIDSLSAKFGLRNEPHMQDWEYEVVDSSRIEEFLCSLEYGELTEDERFTLSEIVMQCFEDLASTGVALAANEQWQRFARVVRARPLLHACTLCYWAGVDSASENVWHVSQSVRPLWAEIEPLFRKFG